MSKRRSMEIIDNTRDTLMENFKNNPKLNKFKDKIDEIEPIISRRKMSVAPLDEAYKTEKLNDALFNKPPSRASSKRTTVDNLNKQLDNKAEFLKPANQRRKKYSTSNFRTAEVDKKTKLNLEQAKVMSIIVKNNLNKGKFTYMLNKLPLTKGVSKIMDLLYPKKYKQTNQRNQEKATLHRASTMAQLNFDNELEEELDISKEMNNVFAQYNELKKQSDNDSDVSSIKRKLTSQNLMEQINTGSQTTRPKKSTFLHRKKTFIKGFLF